jgi:hypothetical protein
MIKVITMEEQKIRFKLIQTKFLLIVPKTKNRAVLQSREKRSPTKEVWPPCLEFELKIQLAELLLGRFWKGRVPQGEHNILWAGFAAVGRAQPGL